MAECFECDKPARPGHLTCEDHAPGPIPPKCSPEHPCSTPTPIHVTLYGNCWFVVANGVAHAPLGGLRK